MYHFDAPLELKFLGGTGVFEGYGAVFGVTDNVNDRIASGAFKKSLQSYKERKRMPPLLWQHDAKQPIGAWRQMYEDDRGLYVEGELFIDDIARAREAYRLLKENVITGLSIGYQAKESYRDKATGTRILTEVDLLEVSMVTFPANELARASLVKSALAEGRVPLPKDFEAFLREAGFSRKQAKGVLSQGYKTLSFNPRDAAEEDRNVMAIDALAKKIRALAYK